MVDGMENGGGKNTMKVANERKVRSSEVLLRFLALLSTLIAVIVTIVSEETELVPVVVLANLPPVYVPATAKWQYSSAFVYFLVANVIACAYAALTLMLSIMKVAGTNGIAMVMIVFDLLVVALLFSSSGAAAAIGVVGYKGNVHVRWEKVCDIFAKYCRYTATAVAVSLFGSTVFLVLLALTALHLRKKSL
ncbi:CASP-like protein 1E1 [Telopea speciosissima]|uniref:CASP-like protein 1E1 n=1 Tax=Telopea speciosissima TaxID=54955 RepID=UPI001CC36CFF|nr:CASP-like protein 1E1 [Telopea speciosissima]